jgi:mRNA interferase RelE/StbE
VNGAYQVTLTARAQRDLDRFANDVLQQLREALEELAQNPRGVGTKKLKGSNGIYRKRSGDYRILYQINDAAREVTVHRVGDRKDIY